MISVVIPARNEEGQIGSVVRAVLEQCPPGGDLEVIVADDASTDKTADEARESGAQVLTLSAESGGNPAAARNRGAEISQGDPIIFLDSDCTPQPGWMNCLLAPHDEGFEVVGGSLDLPAGLSLTARVDYYCGWYHVHPRRASGQVRHHPPCNLSVRREVFFESGAFLERQPAAYAHEELLWQSRMQRRGGRIYFEPRAAVDHLNRPGFKNLLRRNYRWAYSAIETKAESGVARMAWLYRNPFALILASGPLSLASAPYIVYCWLRAGITETLWLFPWILAARVAYAAGMISGGIGWLRTRNLPTAERRPRWE